MWELRVKGVFGMVEEAMMIDDWEIKVFGIVREGGENERDVGEKI